MASKGKVTGVIDFGLVHETLETAHSASEVNEASKYLVNKMLEFTSWLLDAISISKSVKESVEGSESKKPVSEPTQDDETSNSPSSKTKDKNENLPKYNKPTRLPTSRREPIDSNVIIYNYGHDSSEVITIHPGKDSYTTSKTIRYRR